MEESQYKIKRVVIDKLWGVKNIDCSLNDDVNVIIGPNGSGKSTFLNLIEAVLQCDGPVLMSYVFTSVTLHLDSTETKTICVKQEQEDELQLFTYIFDENEEYTFHSYEVSRRYVRSSFRQDTLDAIRDRLRSIVNISWLSVNRFNPAISRDENRSFDENLVNAKVKTLMHDLLIYRLHLESQINSLSNKQNQEVFSLLLFNKEYDVYNPKNIKDYSQLDPKSMLTSLFRVFNQLGISAEKREAIKEHIDAMSKTVEKVQHAQKLELNDIFPLSLVNRTMSIIEISKRYNEERESILEPVSKYLKCLQRFMTDKDFSFSEKTGELHIDLKAIKAPNNIDEVVQKTEIKHNSLSSGEKQLLILLTQTLLQENKRYVFIADEPELSLHIEWQHKIVSTIRELNPNAQIIIATHSPEIAGLWKSKILNLENVISYV